MDGNGNDTRVYTAPRSGRKCKHGLSYTQEYRAWQTMRLRCTVPSNPAFASYGGRGITVCTRWLRDPHAFLADMGPKPTPRHEIDRINNDGGYWCGHADCPDCGPAGRALNCRWATRAENSRNRRSSVRLTYQGETRTLVEWCELRGINYSSALGRLHLGWTIDRILETPVRPKAPKGLGRYSPKTLRAQVSP